MYFGVRHRRKSGLEREGGGNRITECLETKLEDFSIRCMETREGVRFH